MSLVFSLLRFSPFISFPQGIAARLLVFVIWFAGFILLMGIIYRWRSYPSRLDAKARLFTLLAAVAAIPASLFFGVQFAPANALPPPGLPIIPHAPALTIFSALPWMLVSGTLGLIPAVLVAGVGGFFSMLYSTHNLFTPLEFAFYAAVFSVAMHQRFRTWVYQGLRHPFITAALLTIISPLLSVLTNLWLVDGSLAVRLDYALTNLRWNALSSAGILLLGGITAELFRLVFPSMWGNRLPLQPSPAEKSLEARFLYLFTPIIIFLTLLLMGIVWRTAESAARQMIFDRLQSSARLSANSIPYFLEAGQNLIQQIARDPRLVTSSPTEIDTLLQDYRRSIPFFSQLFVINQHGEPIAGSPIADYNRAGALVEEQTGIKLALGGVPFQTYTAPPQPGQDAAQVSFIAAIQDPQGLTQAVLIGRTSLSINPMTEPILANLRSISESGGEGILLDENNTILYHPKSGMLMETYTGRLETQPILFDETGQDGTRKLVYVQAASGRPWTIILSVPARQAQQIAIRIAAPILLMMLLLISAAALYFRYNLSKITSSLHLLAQQAASIAQGRLDQPLESKGEDEEGRLRSAFETMRLSLKARLEELNRLLWVSQGVASSLDLSQAVRPVLESALSFGAASARIVLAPAVLPGLDQKENLLTCFADGHVAQLYAALDEQILQVCRQQERIILTNPFRPRLLNYPPGLPVPESVLAVALKHDTETFGVLWLAFDLPHLFSEEEIRFTTTLASQTTLAVVNARHYLNSEIGRKRLEAILESTPDPIIVTDIKGAVSLANPAALRALSGGKPIVPSAQTLPLPAELLELMRSSDKEMRSLEITLPDGKIYSATASTVLAEGRAVSRVCVLRDVTSFKELDALKSEFVANVSHDLRSPLTLMRGYATMLEMAGSLNDQQLGYIRKIVASVESMTRLVNNLLDLGRIEAGIGLQVELTSAQELVEKATADVKLHASQKRIELTADLPPEGLPLIEADPALILQALHNLMDNAIKFTDAGGKVQIGARVKSDQIIFAVRDNGIGIAPIDQPRLFDKFFRVKRPGERSGGSGLGLAIVKSVAERHHGRAWVESQLGRGSTFYIAIPLRQPHSP
ncbi:MAG: ATP-binding protein [Chloroflexota bacterium]